MTATVEDRITFNQLTEDDFTDAQIVRTKREIRQLAAAFVTLPGGPPLHRLRAQQIAKLAIFMTTGIAWDCCAPEFLAMLTRYAETSLATYGEGGGQ